MSDNNPNNIDPNSFSNGSFKMDTRKYFDKNELEICELVSQNLNQINGFKSISFWKLNQAEFTFSMVYINNYEFEEYIVNCFDDFVENQQIGAILTNMEPIIATVDTDFAFLILPSISTEGLNGIFLLEFSSEKSLQKNLSSISCYFNFISQILYTLQLKNDIEETNRIKNKEIKNITDELAISTRRLTNILNAIPTGILLIDAENYIISDCNKKASEIIGIEKDFIKSTDYKEFFYSSKGKQINEDGFNFTEAFVKHHSGHLIPVLTTYSKILLGSKTFIIECFTDITNKKKLEDDLLKARFELEEKVESRTSELQESNKKLMQEISEKVKAQNEQQKLLMAVHQSPIGIFITNQVGVIEYANPQILKDLGYELDEVINTFHSTYLQQGFSLKVFKNLLKKAEANEKMNHEHKLLRKNGEEFWASITIASIYNSKNKIENFIITVEDISNKKAVEKNLIEARQKAEESEKIKSNILNNLSHEFRTPLISILGFSDMIAVDVEDDFVADMAKRIGVSGQRLLDTLNNIIELSHLEVGSLKCDLEKVSTNTFLDRVYSILKSRTSKIELETQLIHCDSEIPMIADSTLLENCLTKMIDNAVKFTNNGTITLKGILVQENFKEWIVISVIDTGIGINKENVDLIFSEFRQESEGYSRKFDGLGLGLQIAKKMVDMMNGKIVIESEEGVGSTFSIYMPTPYT